jgi:hypothetical protein
LRPETKLTGFILASWWPVSSLQKPMREHEQNAKAMT